MALSPKTFDPNIHHRRSTRLRDYDYAQAGAYFVTICAQHRECLFGEIVDGAMVLNAAGKMVQSVWDTLPNRYTHVALDAFVVMPNHIHGILVLTDPVGAPLVGAQTLVGAKILVDDPSGTATRAPTTRAPTRGAPTMLGGVVGAYKSLTTVEYVCGIKTMGWQRFPGKIWQRNYYEHIIRNETDLARIREYIENNPIQWALDSENPINVGAPLAAPHAAAPHAAPEQGEK